MVVHLLDPPLGIQGLQLHQTVRSITTVKIYLYWLNCPSAVRGYKTLGRVGKESHREAQSAPKLLVQRTGLMLGCFCVWIQCTYRKERRQFLVSSSSSCLFISQWGRRRRQTYSIQIFSRLLGASSNVHFFSLSAAMVKRTEEIFMCVSKWLIL